MRDHTAQLLTGVDAPREIPPSMAWRLEHALYANVTEPTAENLALILDRPRRLPEDMRARLTAVVTGVEPVADRPVAVVAGESAGSAPTAPRSAARIYQMFGAAAAAVLLLAGAIVFAGGDGKPQRGDGTALPPVVVQPSLVPPQKSILPSVRPSVLPTKIRRADEPASPQRPGPRAGAPRDTNHLGGGASGTDAVPGPFAPAMSAFGGGSSGSGSSDASAEPQPSYDLFSSVGGIVSELLRNLGLTRPDAGDMRSVSPIASRPAAVKAHAPRRTKASAGRPARTKPAATTVKAAKRATPAVAKPAPKQPAEPSLLGVQLPDLGVSLSL